MKLWPLSLLPALLLLAACPQPTETGEVDAAAEARAALERSLLDPEATQNERLDRIEEVAVPGNREAVLPLCRAMKHPSQAAFLLVEDPDHPLGYRAVELEEAPPEEHWAERVLCAAALEKIGSPLALPHLLMATRDKDDKVKAHAARALVRLGCPEAGMAVLLSLLDAKAYGNETAVEMLRELSGQDFGFDPDAGAARKKVAAEKWRAWWDEFRASGQRLPGCPADYREGQDAGADRIFHFLVDMQGQMQFKYYVDARAALARLGAQALPYLLAGVEKSDRAAAIRKAGICETLAQIRDPRAEELLGRLLADSTRSVRIEAAEALAQQEPKKALARLTARWRVEEDRGVREALLMAMGLTGDARATAALEALEIPETPPLPQTRRIALFCASGGEREREHVLELLRSSEDAVACNRALRAVTAVLGRLPTYEVGGSPERRRLDTETIRQELERLQP